MRESLENDPSSGVGNKDRGSSLASQGGSVGSGNAESPSANLFPEIGPSGAAMSSGRSKLSSSKWHPFFVTKVLGPLKKMRVIGKDHGQPARGEPTQGQVWYTMVTLSDLVVSGVPPLHIFPPSPYSVTSSGHLWHVSENVPQNSIMAVWVVDSSEVAGPAMCRAAEHSVGWPRLSAPLCCIH